MVSPKIFREYDIRGVVGEDLTNDTARLIGWAFVRYLLDVKQLPPAKAEELTLAVGRDVRLHSEMLCNGFKLCAGKEALHGDSIQEIRQIIEKGKPALDTSGSGQMIEKVEHIEILPFYLAYLKEQFVFPDQVIRPAIKVVVDSGNGTAGVIAPAILREMGCEVIEVYSQPDGRFPNHHPGPTVPENLEDLIKSVRQNNADLGVAYDGDADRIGVVDETGDIIWGDRLMIIYAREILK